MKFASILLGVGCLAMLVYEIEGYCDVKYKDKPSSTCDLPIGTINVGVFVTNYKECIKYFCNDYVYGHCGIGYKAGLAEMEGCVQIKLDKCCYQFVKKSDRSTPCEEKQCPE